MVKKNIFVGNWTDSRDVQDGLVCWLLVLQRERHSMCCPQISLEGMHDLVLANPPGALGGQ